MTRRSTVWLVAAVIFTLVNLGGGVYAAVRGEVLHAGIHAGLLLLGALIAWRLAPRRGALTLPYEIADRLTRLEQSVDAVAIEVERIGEGQRFMTRLFAEKRTPRAPGQGAGEPVETEAQEGAPPTRHG